MEIGDNATVTPCDGKGVKKFGDLAVGDKIYEYRLNHILGTTGRFDKIEHEVKGITKPSPWRLYIEAKDFSVELVEWKSSQQHIGEFQSIISTNGELNEILDAVFDYGRKDKLREVHAVLGMI